MHNTRKQNLIRTAIDIGSNTIHLVVARCSPDDLEILLDEQELVRIGESVTSTGEISPQKRDAAISTLLHYQKLAANYTSSPPLVVATEAIRKAHNKEQFLADIHHATGLVVHCIDGNVEAMLTFYGATYELYQEPHPPSLIGVLDLGGGSMELVTANKKHVTWHTSVPLGSGWLHDRYLQADPPTPEDVEVAYTFLHAYIDGLPIKQRPPAMIATGGSANSLLLLVRRALGLDEQASRLTYEQILRCQQFLYTLSAEEISQRYDQPLKRARLLPAGALIITTLMAKLQLSEIRISTHGIREGALLAYARYGDQWLQHLQEDTSTSAEPVNTSPDDELVETFAQSASRRLLERTHKMLDWRADVLKHEDIEAVHKMRVASRRLRALLDAYETACDKKKFALVYRHVKEIADVLGKARDTDVMIEHLQHRLAQAPADAQPGLQWLLDRLQTYRQAHQKHLETFLQALDSEALIQQITSCLSAKGNNHGKG